MKHTPFDPKKAVTFDLPHGEVRTGDAASPSDTARALIVPEGSLAALASAAGETATQELGRSIGRTLGSRVASRMSGAESVRGAGLEEVTAELAAEVAVHGFGELSFERWGKALVAVVHHPPPACGKMIAPLIEGLLSAATGRTLRTLTLTRETDPLRVLVARGESVDRVAGWLGEGVSWGDAITRLHGGAA